MRCLLVLVLLVVVVAVVVWLALRPAQPPEALRATPLAGLGSYADQPALAPDGRRVACISNRDQADNPDVYVKPVGRGAPLRLTRHAAAEYSPAWSPDGRQVAFLRAGPAGLSELLVLPAAGGPERKAGEVRLQPDSPFLPGPFLCWSPDARALVVTDRQTPETPPSLYLLSLETGAKRRLTSPPLGAPGDSGPSFSPDGRVLAFTRAVGYAVADLYVVSVTEEFMPAAGAARRTYENRFTAGTAWTPDGEQIVYGGHAGADRALYRVRGRGPEPPERLQGVGQGGGFPTVSTLARRLVYARAAGAVEPLLGPAELAPDGQRRAFASARSGRPEVWTCFSDGAGCAPLTSLGAACTGFPRWSPDSQYLVFFSNLEGQNEVYVVPLAGTRPRRVTNDPGDDILPAFSPDGDWIYFSSNRAGSYQPWKVRSFGADLTARRVMGPEEAVAAARIGSIPATPPRPAELMLVDRFQ